METYIGYTDCEVNEEQLANFYENKNSLIPSPIENHYYLLWLNGEIVDKCKYEKGNFHKVEYNTIKTRQLGTVKPRNIEQELAIDLLYSRESKVKLIKGVYGSGKDYLMLSQALSLIEKGTFQKIVFIRPNVTVANVPEIGYLKGDEREKLAWTLAPLYDKVGGEEGVLELMDRGQLESVPLLFLRGRSFENSIVYVCEGQNITTEIAKLIISRLGEGSELWINSDTHQVDRKVYEQDNGVNRMIERLQGHPLFGMVYLPKTERSALAELATLLD